MKSLRIKNTAVLIGFDAEGQCVYSEICELADYYDGTHVWDEAKKVKMLKLQKVQGYLFDDGGELDQEFESVFDTSTGKFRSGRVRYADGTETQT